VGLQGFCNLFYVVAQIAFLSINENTLGPDLFCFENIVFSVGSVVQSWFVIKFVLFVRDLKATELEELNFV
jgi:hypothetical protein